MRVLIVEDEPYMSEAIRDGLRLEAIAADIAGDGDTALELVSVNAYDIAVLDRDIATPGDAPTDVPAPPLRRTLGEVYRFDLVRTRDGWRISRLENVRLWVSVTSPQIA
jgi:DNA-binding NarL/FixJ family response regulator